MTSYPNLLKEWRNHRRMSQLSLAVEADVSARHISFLETGRSRPSPEMIVHLSEVMEVPMDARNQMMRAAGFAPRYTAIPLDDTAMAPIRDAVAWTLERHAPYPGLVLDRLWRIIKLNDPAAMLFAPLGLGEGLSLLDLLTNPMMADVVENWPEVAHYTMLRLRAESAAAGGILELEAAIKTLAAHAYTSSNAVMGPSIPTVYRFAGQRLSMFGTIAQFSTVADETLDDLKVELFFPADDESAALLTALANQPDIT
ncbi:MmyB family transcriptional regulator [Roseovarius aestuarii]|uniref:Helix-turn-helix protein n=1 Tax=Roseovarius aestuarii TaxID=475083 RepID=A0A1X7BYG2_9RHOB|nr:helix-turn-helix domain-containing protein [Roseovarius aestuarii]SMC14623.1 helix-turn-helix protein [Roseovarius aestuarii]